MASSSGASTLDFSCPTSCSRTSPSTCTTSFSNVSPVTFAPAGVPTPTALITSSTLSPPPRVRLTPLLKMRASGSSKPSVFLPARSMIPFTRVSHETGMLSSLVRMSFLERSSRPRAVHVMRLRAKRKPCDVKRWSYSPGSFFSAFLAKSRTSLRVQNSESLSLGLTWIRSRKSTASTFV